jgi:cation diffusion facilitator CzcD-associated flavoprotein CzcO
MGGISAGVVLRKAGIESITIYESSERVGGTWWDNQYPGAEVDVDSYIYSFPFKRHDWTRTHARQAEIHCYLEETVADFGLTPHLRLGVGVQRAVWDDDLHVYRLTLTNGDTTDCHVLISAVGFLNVPYYPDWPGLDDFLGPCFHTSRWEHQHDLTAKTVAVVGTGSTASQLVPALQPVAKKILLFQREPGWVLPKGDRDYTPEERRQLHNPLVHRYRRLKWYWATEKRLWNGGAYRPGQPAHTAAEDAARRYIAKVFADRPDLAEAVTPDYPFWGKRTIFSSDFYPALKQPNVELVPRAVCSVTPHGLVDADGVEHRADVLVLSTGFQPTNYLAHLEVVGRTGDSIHKYWAGEPRAFLGVTVPTFPNFYMLYGPGTNGGEIALNLRNQAAYARRAIKRMMREGVTAIEVKPSWAEPYHAWLMTKMSDTAWAVSNNYFTTSNGKVVTQWPFSALDYGALLKTLGPVSESVRSRGAKPEDVHVDPDVLEDATADEPLRYERW